MTRWSLLFLWLVCSVVKGAEFKLVFRAIDDDGKPVANARVGLATDVGPFVPLGMGKNVYKNTDDGGYAEFEGRTDLPSFDYGGSKEGYYPVYQIKTHFLGKSALEWQPWGGVMNIVLKRIKKPTPLYALNFYTETAFHKPQGYDLIAGDWVHPYGSGDASDIILSFDGEVEKPSVYHAEFMMKFPGAGNGIVAVPRDASGSRLRMPYEAPREGYQSEIVFHRDSASDLIPRSDQERIEFENRGGDYFFRVRSEQDTKGNVIKALYGKIHSPVRILLLLEPQANHSGAQFTYYLNPDATTNLEFDSRRNLFKKSKLHNAPEVMVGDP